MPGYVGKYQVSDLGRVRSLTQPITRRNGVVAECVGRILTPGRTGNRLTVALRRRSRYVHRLVFEAFSGPIPAHLVVGHINRDWSDNRLENLRLASKSLNGLNSMRQNVTYHRVIGKWWARLIVNGNETNLGYFPTREEAVAVYAAAKAAALDFIGAPA